MTSVPIGIGVSLLLTIGLTCLYALVEVLVGARREIRETTLPRTQPKIRSCITGKYWLYVVCMIQVNFAGALLAWYQLPRWFPLFVEKLGFFSFFVYALVGVLLFQVLVTNTDIWIFSKGIMAFQTFTSKARTPAIGAAVEKESERDRERQQRLADALYSLLSQTELDAQMEDVAGKEEAENLKTDANNATDPHMYKLLWLARRHPIVAKSILKNKRESGE